MKRILIITHDATRTGAPLVMLYLLRWLRKHQPRLSVDVLAVKGGTLADEFRSASDVYCEWTVLPPPSRSIAVRAVRKVMRTAGLLREPTTVEVKEAMLVELAARNYDVILANSLASIPVGVRMKELALGRPLLISFIQELEMVIRQVLPDLHRYIPKVDRFWAVSELGRDNLVRNWGMPLDRIEVQYVTALVGRSEGALRVPQREGEFRVGAVGSVVMRKGYDLFIQVARWVKVNHPELKVRFTWVGKMSAYDEPLIQHDLEHAGLKDVVEFVGEMADPTSVYEQMDVFLLPSREEPFGLVCIEAGTKGKPIICFEGVTGAAEVLQNAGGVIVPYLDVEAMARAVVDYIQDPEKRSAHGDLNRAQFAKLGTEEQCPLMWQRIMAAWNEQASKR